MSDATFALNTMILAYDAYYLIQDSDVVRSRELEEFVKSGYWTHDDALGGWKCPRTALALTEAAFVVPPREM